MNGGIAYKAAWAAAFLFSMTEIEQAVPPRRDDAFREASLFFLTELTEEPATQ